jgi:hypothetical protein
MAIVFVPETTGAFPSTASISALTASVIRAMVARAPRLSSSYDAFGLIWLRNIYFD